MDQTLSGFKEAKIWFAKEEILVLIQKGISTLTSMELLRKQQVSNENRNINSSYALKNKEQPPNS